VRKCSREPLSVSLGPVAKAVLGGTPEHPVGCDSEICQTTSPSLMSPASSAMLEHQQKVGFIQSHAAFWLCSWRRGWHGCEHLLCIISCHFNPSALEQKKVVSIVIVQKKVGISCW